MTITTATATLTMTATVAKPDVVLPKLKSNKSRYVTKQLLPPQLRLHIVIRLLFFFGEVEAAVMKIYHSAVRLSTFYPIHQYLPLHLYQNFLTRWTHQLWKYHNLSSV